METNLKELAAQATVLDPAAQQLGRLYAQALLGAAKSSGDGDRVVDQLQGFVAALAEQPVLREIMASPRVSVAEKIRVLDRLVAPHVAPVLMRFLKVVAQRSRLQHLADIAQAAVEMRDEALGRVVAHVRTATPLTDDLRQSITDKMSQLVSRQVVLRESVDPELIGGMIVRIGDTVYDASISGRLDRMNQSLRSGFASRLTAQASRFFSGDVAS